MNTDVTSPKQDRVKGKGFGLTPTPISNKKSIQQLRHIPAKIKTALPLFHTAPIFKPKKHDPL